MKSLTEYRLSIRTYLHANGAHAVLPAACEDGIYAYLLQRHAAASIRRHIRHIARMIDALIADERMGAPCNPHAIAMP